MLAEGSGGFEQVKSTKRRGERVDRALTAGGAQMVEARSSFHVFKGCVSGGGGVGAICGGAEVQPADPGSGQRAPPLHVVTTCCRRVAVFKQLCVCVCAY